MPKGSKKKKEKVADFSKAKLKLGKGRQLASNVVDTSFKARSIALPIQSITIEKDIALPTTRKKQSFDDLLSHMKHYNANTRKDAVTSLRELFQLHPEIVESSMTTLLGACVRLIGDEDAGVRKTLLSFLSWLLPLVPKEDLIPHVPLLILFTTSAQTNIFPEIRIDAVRFLDLFLELVPESVVNGWMEGNSGHGKRVLEGYLGILSAGTKYGGAEGAAQATSTASVVLSAQSKLVVLKSLSTFLTHAVSRLLRSPSNFTKDLYPAAVPLPTWFLAPSFSSSRSFTAYERLFPSEATDVQPWLEVDDLEDDYVICMPDFVTGTSTTAWSLNDLSDLSLAHAESLTHPSNNTSSLIHLARTLYSTLLASYLDCAPVVFSPSANPPEAELNLLTVTARIMRTLYGSVLQNRVSVNFAEEEVLCDELRTLLGYMTGYFPFRPARREIKVEHAFQDLNVIYCELTALLVLASSRRQLGNISHKAQIQTSRSSAYSSQAKHEGQLTLQAGLVRTYVISLLLGEDNSAAQISRSLIASMYAALLPTIWALLNQPKEKHASGQGVNSRTVLSTVLDHAIGTTSNSAVKALTIEFIARILLLETESDYCGHFDVRKTKEQEKFQEWILHLPRTLWELGTHNLAASETIIRSLLRLLQRGSSVIKHEEIIGLRSRLIPFFLVTHPVRGRLPGPYTKIPASSPRIRRLAVDLVVTILSVSPKSEGEEKSNFMDAVTSAVSGTFDEGYWHQLVRATGLS